jgi:hypothetical protein
MVKSRVYWAGGWPKTLLETSFLRPFAVLLASAAGARANVALLLEEPFAKFGTFNPTGHAAVYLSGVCAASPVLLRRCNPGETGVVISRYYRVGGYDWLAIPLLPYLYAVDDPAEFPQRWTRKPRRRSVTATGVNTFLISCPMAWVEQRQLATGSSLWAPRTIEPSMSSRWTPTKIRTIALWPPSMRGRTAVTSTCSFTTVRAFRRGSSTLSTRMRSAAVGLGMPVWILQSKPRSRLCDTAGATRISATALLSSGRFPALFEEAGRFAAFWNRWLGPEYALPPLAFVNPLVAGGMALAYVARFVFHPGHGFPGDIGATLSPADVASNLAFDNRFTQTDYSQTDYRRQ